jgi:histidinol dehydrogenase
MTAPEAIVADIRERGNAALTEWAVRLDGGSSEVVVPEQRSDSVCQLDEVERLAPEHLVLLGEEAEALAAGEGMTAEAVRR